MSAFTAAEAKKAIRGATRPTWSSNGQRSTGGDGIREILLPPPPPLLIRTSLPLSRGWIRTGKMGRDRIREVGLQQASARPAKGNNKNNNNGGPLPYKHTEEVMKWLSDKRLCFRCCIDDMVTPQHCISTKHYTSYILSAAICSSFSHFYFPLSPLLLLL